MKRTVEHTASTPALEKRPRGLIFTPISGLADREVGILSGASAAGRRGRAANKVAVAALLQVHTPDLAQPMGPYPGTTQRLLAGFTLATPQAGPGVQVGEGSLRA